MTRFEMIRYINKLKITAKEKVTLQAHIESLREERQVKESEIRSLERIVRIYENNLMVISKMTEYGL